MGGFGEAIKSRLLSQQAHLTIELDKNPFSFEKKEDINQIKLSSFFSNLTPDQQKGIKKVIVFETQELILKSGGGVKGISAIGYSDYQWNKKLETALTTTIPSFNETTNESHRIPIPLKIESEKEILLSYELSLEMGLSVNDTITFIPLIGLLLPFSIPPPVKSFKIKAILPSAETAQGNVSIYYKQGLMDFGDFSKVKYRTEIQLHEPEKVRKYQKNFKHYKTKNWIEQNSALFFALKLEKFIMTLFLVLTLIISCFGISSALILLVTQKREDIAILQAIGMSQKEIVKVFTRMGLYLSGLGILLGTLTGILGTLALKYNRFNILPDTYQDRTIPTVFMPYNYLIIFIGSFVLAWIFCYLPSRYLSRIKTVELLKSSQF